MNTKTKKVFQGCYWLNHLGVDVVIKNEEDNCGKGWSIRKADVENGEVVGYGDADELFDTKKDAVSAATAAIDHGYIK